MELVEEGGKRTWLGGISSSVTKMSWNGASAGLKHVKSKSLKIHAGESAGTSSSARIKDVTDVHDAWCTEVCNQARTRSAVPGQCRRQAIQYGV